MLAVGDGSRARSRAATASPMARRATGTAMTGPKSAAGGLRRCITLMNSLAISVLLTAAQIAFEKYLRNTSMTA